MWTASDWEAFMQEQGNKPAYDWATVEAWLAQGPERLATEHTALQLAVLAACEAERNHD
jgi:hypothetical protein